MILPGYFYAFPLTVQCDIYILSVYLLERNKKIKIYTTTAATKVEIRNLLIITGINTAEFESCDFQTPPLRWTAVVFTLENAIDMERKANMYGKRKKIKP